MPDPSRTEQEEQDDPTADGAVESPIDQDLKDDATAVEITGPGGTSRRPLIITAAIIVVLFAVGSGTAWDSIGIWLPFLLLFLFMTVGVPIAYSMLLSGIVGIYMAIGLGGTVGMLGTVPQATAASHALTTIPMFILMAEFLSQGRLTRELFRMAANWLAPFRGGLAMAVVGANGIFGAMSGSSVAAAGLLASVSVPEMRRYGYSERLALGTVASAGTFSVMIPPSIALIIYGIATETSIGRLFAAGFLPALATLLVYLLIVYGWARIYPDAAPRAEKVDIKERLSSLRAVLPAIPLIVLVLGGIYAGVMTPTEAGAVGAAGALVVSVAVGGLRWNGIRRAIINSTAITAMILLIVIGANLFGNFLSVSGATTAVVGFVTESDISPWTAMIMMLVIYVFLGTFMSQTAILLLTLPLTFPLAVALGFHPIWFGIVVVKTAEIGLASPPLGLNCYVTFGVAGGKLKDVFWGSGTFLVGDFLVLAAILASEDLVVAVADLIFQA